MHLDEYKRQLFKNHRDIQIHERQIFKLSQPR